MTVQIVFFCGGKNCDGIRAKLRRGRIGIAAELRLGALAPADIFCARPQAARINILTADLPRRAGRLRIPAPIFPPPSPGSFAEREFPRLRFFCGVKAFFLKGRFQHSSIAASTACAKLFGDAADLPAMENAVPWSGLVRTNGRFIDMFTAESNSRVFRGASPWS